MAIPERENKEVCAILRISGVGERIELVSRTVPEEEIIAFARQFDPQPFHVSPEQAKDSFYGGLIASGWHTVSLLMRLMAGCADQQHDQFRLSRCR